jgi:ParB-like chromosome segregation protein Spo0J
MVEHIDTPIVEYRNIPIKELVLLENNPRKITKSNMDKLCDSLINDPTFLRSRPILVNLKDGVYYVYAGNQRVRAAKKLKWKEIFCNVEQDLSDDLIRQRIVKDNKHAGEFDYDLLASNYDVSELINFGFSPEELHLNLDNDEIKPSDEEKEKKLKCCPNCGCEF